MDVVFNPPIGDSIQLETSISSQTVLLNFTAQLAAHDHNQLIQARARIQLWSDLPHDGQSLSDSAWGASDLTHQTQATEMSSLNKGGTYPIHASEEKVTLFLEVVAPVHTSRPFSFTYRIIYPSGDIKWLGAFGQNGSLSFHRSDYDLRDFGLHSWTFDKSRMAHVYDVNQSVGISVVARVGDAYNYRVRAIGPTSSVSNLKDAALLFFVPSSQPSAISLLPTYVFSASTGLSLTLSADGQIIASGSGTLLFQANEGHSEPLTFIRKILSHAGLDSWNILAWNAGSKTIVLATPKDKFPIKAVAIPLWRSKCPIHLEPTTLCDLLGSTEFSIFSPDNMRIHLFTVDPQATQKISLRSDATGNEFVMSPIYTLRGYQATTDKSTTIWKTAILSSYDVQHSSSDDSGILPTPPPTPHLQPIARPSQATHSLYDAAMSSVSSLPSDTSVQSPMNGNDDRGSPSPPINPDTNAHSTLQIQKRSSLPSPRNIITMFRSLFSSIFFFVYRLFWGHLIGPLSRGNTTKDRPQSQVSTGPEDDILSPLDEDAPDDSAESLVGISETKILVEGNIDGNTEIHATQVRPSQSDAEMPEADTKDAVSGVSPASDNAKGDVYYLQSDRNDSSSKKITTIALLYTTHNDSSTTTEDTSVINKNKIMERCVQFLDGSEPECVVSRCDVDVFYQGNVSEERQVESGSCYLLQYQLDWGDLEKSERTIRISPPRY